MVHFLIVYCFIVNKNLDFQNSEIISFCFYSLFTESPNVEEIVVVNSIAICFIYLVSELFLK